ncbi:MAG: hypothetical protein HXS52_13155 [Theionarchaea archaeon]|nr:hypothetical protein [Theionarchaea archaeon]
MAVIALKQVPPPCKNLIWFLYNRLVCTEQSKPKSTTKGRLRKNTWMFKHFFGLRRLSYIQIDTQFEENVGSVQCTELMKAQGAQTARTSLLQLSLPRIDSSSITVSLLQ